MRATLQPLGSPKKRKQSPQRQAKHRQNEQEPAVIGARPVLRNTAKDGPQQEHGDHAGNKQPNANRQQLKSIPCPGRRRTGSLALESRRSAPHFLEFIQDQTASMAYTTTPVTET